MGLKLLELAKNIRQIVNKRGSKYIIRNKKTNEHDGLLFSLLHTQKSVSMDSAAASFNDFNENILKRKDKISRQSLSSRASDLPESFYKNVCNDVFKLIDKMYNKRKKSDRTYEICAVDGSDSNVSKSIAKDGFKLNKNGNTVTALNMGIYNVTRNYPVDIQMVNHKNERKAFLDMINKRKDFSNTIFVFDRGFDGQSFFEKLERMNIKYLCRIRSNSLLVTDNNDMIHMMSEHRCRIINYNIGNKKYYLTTNLFDTNEFTIPVLSQLYNKRWTIEESFKYMKNNFSFGVSELTSAIAIRKSIYCQMMIMKLVNLIAKINSRQFTRVKANRIINKKTLTDGFYRGFIFRLFSNTLSRRNILSFNKNYIVLITTNTGKFNERICVTPGLKWYTKQHTNKQNPLIVDG